jgi:isopenicillin-N N-acyltransferase like protein
MLHVLRKKLAVIIVCLFALSAQGPYVFACSLWAVTGDRSIDGGTLVGMTWDVSRETKGELRFVIPQKGFRYLGLFPLESKISARIVAGINEHGLATITATTDTVAPKKKLTGGGNLVETILTSFASVDAVFANKARFTRSSPLFLIIADQSKVALVQIGSGDNFTVEVTSNGLFYQTNHYTHQNLLKENERYIENSLLRLNRLQYLLANHPDRFTIDDFVTLAGDKNNGPDNSIWRIGSSLKKERTLASWVVFLPKNSSPELYFKLVNPGSNELNYDIKLDKPFWTEGTD